MSRERWLDNTGYPGLCGSDDLQGSVDPIYHSESFDEMYGYVSQGLGQFCGELIITGNTAPLVNAGTDYTVPKRNALGGHGGGAGW